MIPLLDNAKLITDLDAGSFNLLNVGAFSPLPPNLVDTSDPALSDAREPLPGSVTNASVNAAAAIAQSKLNLDGTIPATWLGTASTQAAQGNLAEYLSNKNQPNGYAGLDGSGKILSANLPGTTGTGTVTSVGLSMPAQFSVSGSPVTNAGTLAASWVAVADNSWFGNKSGGAAAPQFYTTPLPTVLIPDLDTSKVVSGTFPSARLPVAVGLGVSHAAGAVPDPGDGTGGALATDYLARDMSWQPIPALGPTYQPTIPNPTLSPSGNITGPIIVAFSDSVNGVTFFYSTTSASTGFQEVPSTGYVSLAAGDTLWSYAARPGYVNSAVVSITNSNPP